MHRAILIRDERRGKQIIKRGGPIHIRSFAGETPIMMAVRNGLLEVIRSLSINGADMFEKTYKGDSLLHLAARTDLADVIGYLLDKGLSTEDRNRDGARPTDLAKRPAIKELLSYKNLRHDVYKDQKVNLRMMKSPQLNMTKISEVSEND